jgi:polar amino acid transport system substrate-binding protein
MHDYLQDLGSRLLFWAPSRQDYRGWLTRLSCFLFLALLYSTYPSAAYPAAEGPQGLGLTPEEQAFLAAHPTLKAHNERNWPPFNFVVAGRPSGFSIDYMNLLASKLGIEVEYVTGPTWDQFLQMIREGEIDVMLNIMKTQQRDTFLLFTRPFLEMSAGIYVHEGTSGIASLEDLEGKTVALAKGFYTEELLGRHYPGVKLKLVDDMQQALEVVAYGQADATLGKISVMKYLIEKNFISNVKLAGQVKDQRFNSTLRLAVKKNNPLLRDILQKAMARISEQEVIALRRKWSNFTEAAAGNREMVLSPGEEKYLAAKGPVRMCVDPDWMPFESIDENGRYIGMAADYMQVLQQRNGLSFELVPTVSWAESMEYARSRMCDILTLAAPTPERRKFLDFTAPYFNISVVIVTRSEEMFIERLEQVLDRQLGAVKGVAVIEILRSRYPGIRLQELESVRDGLEKVRNGEIFGFIDSAPSAGYAIQQLGFPDVKIAGNLGITWDLSIAVRSDESELLSILDKALNAMDPGLKHQIENKWISVRYERHSDNGLVWKMAGVFVLALALFLYRNRQLARFNREIKLANDKTAETNRLLLEKTFELERLSTTDRLTQIYNRMRLEEVFQQEILRADRYQKTFSTIMLDLDGFKVVNDSYGHPAGDRVLIGIAKSLQSNIRATDVLGRWGGEEFLIICPETELEGARLLAEQLCREIEALEFPGIGKVTASFGVAEHHPGEQENELVSRADNALYRAKHNGKNRVEVAEG